jgi:FMN phosphatase YigB (HAD superfamily)
MSSAKHRFKIQTLVIDVFHTLVDPEDYRPKDFRRTDKIAELFKIDPEAFAKYWSEILEQRCTKQKKTIDYVQEYVSKITGKSCSKKDLAMAELILGRYQDLAIRNPDILVPQTVASLKYYGLKLGLLSNVDEREVAAWLYSPLI